MTVYKDSSVRRRPEKTRRKKTQWGKRTRQKIWVRTLAQALNSPSYEATQATIYISVERFHLSELTGPGELVLPGPNGKTVASLRDYARDMTCLRGQLRVLRKQTNMADMLSLLIVCEFFLVR